MTGIEYKLELLIERITALEQEVAALKSRPAGQDLVEEVAREVTTALSEAVGRYSAPANTYVSPCNDRNEFDYPKFVSGGGM